jgi:hypothetical protein
MPPQVIQPEIQELEGTRDQVPNDRLHLAASPVASRVPPFEDVVATSSVTRSRRIPRERLKHSRSLSAFIPGTPTREAEIGCSRQLRTFADFAWHLPDTLETRI